MGWKEFAAHVFGDLVAWPMLAFVTVLLLLKQIRALIDRIKRIKGPGFDLDLQAILAQAEEAAREALVEAVEDRAEADEDRAEPEPEPDSEPETDDASQRHPIGPTTDADGSDSTTDPAPTTYYMRDYVTLQRLEALPIGSGYGPSVYDPPRALLDFPDQLMRIAYIELEEAIVDLYATVFSWALDSRMTPRMLDRLRDKRVITDAFHESALAIREIADRTRHQDSPVPLEVARRYYRIANQLSSIAQRARKDWKRDQRAKQGEPESPQP
ncbi:hypothetical protein [Microbacterium sp. SLBN-111]|uniref:hypothetical protein n=1 Tax=Microbacterium sp. SLBN-111 TaxID=3377733 RepID=UPI003C74236C